MRLLRTLVPLALALVTLGADKPVALLVEVEALGRGNQGTVLGVVIQVAPEDRARLGEKVRVSTILLAAGQVVDRQPAVVELEADGSALLHREWLPGTYELRVEVASLDGVSSGLWIDDVTVPESDQPFSAPEGAAPDAVALQVTPPRPGAVRFLPPPDRGGIGGLQLEVEAPEGTASIEFSHDGEVVGRRNRPPWTVSVPLGEIVRRTVVRAVARDAAGNFLGEDALVLNSPTDQLGVEILLAPKDPSYPARRTVTVSVTGASTLQQVNLSLDDRPVARWLDCPCVAELAAQDIEAASILAAEAIGANGARGDAVLTLEGASGFSSTVTVELVELPVVVLDAGDQPVAGLTAAAFKVFEDDQPVSIEGFGTTADLPLSLALAVDVSGSMTETFPEVKRAVSGFADALLAPGDEVILLTFAWDTTVVVDWTDQKHAVTTKLDRVVPEGGTSLHDAVVRSLEQFRGRRGRQALVLLTDGEDTTSRTGWQAAERYAHTMRIPIFPIGLGLGGMEFAARKVLRDLAEESGGAAFFPKDAEALPAVYDRIAELLRSQYLLWYRSSSNKPPEELRSVRVEVADDSLTVRTIRGYYPGR